ncbi:MAG TPA: hypothetical protein VEC16_04140 [Alphaproteobacteria bacterium]|nr:hypothetical protein [Alphaproteobacteria bacterium]
MNKIIIVFFLLIVSVVGAIALIGPEGQIETEFQAKNPQGEKYFPVEGIERVQECIDAPIIIKEPIYESCLRVKKICDNSTNECTNTTINSSCYKGRRDVESTIKECRTKSYKFNNYEINVEGYKCSTAEDQDNKIILCDSIYDGNGDGICTSGESCMKYVINGNSVQEYSRNSGEEFTWDDDSFYLDKIQMEVVQ